ncbi:MAG: hypothetical protein AAFR46_08310 [Pseudomonadota bacterium]
MAELSPEAEAALNEYFSKHKDEIKKTIVGRSWPDLFAGYPAWFVGLAALSFVALLIWLTIENECTTAGTWRFGDCVDTQSTETGDEDRDGPDAQNTSNDDDLLARLLPPGAVVAFDLPNGCPAGWANFDAGAGRFIIGVGGTYQLPYVAGVPRYQIGGEETVALTELNMPAHNHVTFIQDNTNETGKRTDQTYPSIAGRNVDVRNATFSSNTGQGLPHNNMPPYIALYFCKKLSTEPQ